MKHIEDVHVSLLSIFNTCSALYTTFCHWLQCILPVLLYVNSVQTVTYVCIHFSLLSSIKAGINT